jgi:hypothetical protein
MLGIPIEQVMATIYCGASSVQPEKEVSSSFGGNAYVLTSGWSRKDL